MNQSDFTKLADRLRRLADLVETRGEKALRVASQWTQARHPNSVGAGDPDFTPDAPDKRDRLDPRRHARLVANFGRLDADVATLTGLILDTVPRAPDKARDGELDENEGWCKSCYRIGMFTPEHCHADGRVKHKALCSWCASFRTENGVLPPEALLRKRRDGKKITEADVAEALGRKKAS